MRSPRLPLWLLLATTLWSSLGHSAEPTDAERAVQLGHDGLTFFQKGAMADAYDRFSEAEKLVHSPVFLLHMARAKRALGDLLTARAHALRVARDPLPQGAPSSWLSAQADAIRELNELDAMTPSLLVLIDAPPGAVQLTLDGAPLDEAARRAPVLQNPGPHTLVATQDTRSVSVSVTLPAEAKVVEAKVVLPRPTPVGPAPLPGPSASTTATAPPSAPPEPASHGSSTPGIIVLSAGGAALGLGVVAGLVAQSKADDVLSRCVGDQCLASDKDLADSAEQWASLSTAGIVVGALALPVGATLLIFKPFGTDTEVRVSPGVSSASVDVVF